jgi:uncharacterized 2Fe-2S/4Fe-4S cluster protein (DUF4445 family)
MESKKVTVMFQPSGARIIVDKGMSLYDAARLASVKIRSVCAGVGQCGKCKVIIEDGLVREKSTVRSDFLTKEELNIGYYLACQTIALSDVRVLVPPETRIGGQKILSEAVISRVELKPSTKKVFLEDDFGKITSASMRAARLSRKIIDDFPDFSYSLSPNAIEKISRLPKEPINGITITASTCRSVNEVVDIEVGNTSQQNYGLAVDIGTTKVVCYLVDLIDGEIIDVESDYNRQLAYGEDLLSRINYVVTNKDGLIRLQRAVIETINDLVGKLTSDSSIRAIDVTDITISGNTVMTYLFTGTDPKPLIKKGTTISRIPIQQKAQTLGLDVNPNSCVYCFPSISSFFGGDAVSDLLASGMVESSEISVLIDMGTNGEIMLGNRDWIVSTSCAAGPAFEGWEITFGTRSVLGAIEHIQIDPLTLKASYTVIGGRDQKPRGICGSGIIDAVAEMFQRGIIDWLGKFREVKSPFLRKGPDSWEYIVSPANENDLNKDIIINQKDINNLIDSKAAVCGALTTLMKKVGLSIRDVKRVFLAGAFGNYVDAHSAVTIGIFPKFPNAKVIQIGNGSIAGAYLALLSLERRGVLEEISNFVTYYDLTVDPDFMDEYSAAFSLPGRPEYFPKD